jgi:glycosyltransferase involved in cell wall biosynthesis
MGRDPQMTATGQNKQRQPLVSIVIPVYNGANYMREAIDSALAQTYPNIEILVINDGSTDETENIALSYGDRIRYFSQRNGGQSAALNRGIQEMRGEYFSWLSHDDRFYPNKIEKQIQLAKFHDFVIAVYFHAYDVIDFESKVISKKDDEIDTVDIRWQMLVSSPINGCTALIPKMIFRSMGGFNSLRPHTSDVELFYKISYHFPYIYDRVVLSSSRVHPQQATYRQLNYHFHETSLYLIDSILAYSGESFEVAGLGIDNNKLCYLCRNWAGRGYWDAVRQLTGYLDKINISRRILLKCVCMLLYIRKVLKVKIKQVMWKTLNN